MSSFGDSFARVCPITGNAGNRANYRDLPFRRRTQKLLHGELSDTFAQVRAMFIGGAEVNAAPHARVFHFLYELRQTGIAPLDAQRRNAVSIPVVGSVAAGAPILAEQNIEDHMLLSSDMAQDGNFLLRVRGESMINAGILDGDLVLVKPQQEATNGSIVVALVDGDATVKRFERGNGHVKLIAENPAYEPIVTTNVSLVGVVRGVIRLLK